MKIWNKNKYNGKTKLPKDLCYIEGYDRDDYLHDMKLCQSWATFNRFYILVKICLFLGITIDNSKVNETIHNYIDDKNMVRKIKVNIRDNSL